MNNKEITDIIKSKGKSLLECTRDRLIANNCDIDYYIYGMIEGLYHYYSVIAGDKSVDITNALYPTLHNFGVVIAISMEGRSPHTNLQRPRVMADATDAQIQLRHDVSAHMKMRVHISGSYASQSIASQIGFLEDWLLNRQQYVDRTNHELKIKLGTGTPEGSVETRLVAIDPTNGSSVHELTWTQRLQQLRSDLPPRMVAIKEIIAEYKQAGEVQNPVEFTQVIKREDG